MGRVTVGQPGRFRRTIQIRDAPQIDDDAKDEAADRVREELGDRRLAELVMAAPPRADIGTVTFAADTGDVVSIDLDEPPPSGATATGGRSPAQFDIVDVDGEVVLSLEPGDAVEVTFFNTIAGREDTFQGVIEAIGPGTGTITFTDGTVITGDDTAFVQRQAQVVIDGRTRGQIRGADLTGAFRKLFE